MRSAEISTHIHSTTVSQYTLFVYYFFCKRENMFHTERLFILCTQKGKKEKQCDIWKYVPLNSIRLFSCVEVSVWNSRRNAIGWLSNETENYTLNIWRRKKNWYENDQLRRQHYFVWGWGCTSYRPCVEFHQLHRPIFAVHRIGWRWPPDQQSNRAEAYIHKIESIYRCRWSHGVAAKRSYCWYDIH